MMSAAIIAAIASSATACGGPQLSNGYIRQLSYTPASQQVWAFMKPSQCWAWGYVPYTPYYGCVENDPPEWQFKICEANAPESSTNPCSWVDVDQATYDRAHVSEYYQTRA